MVLHENPSRTSRVTTLLRELSAVPIDRQTIRQDRLDLVHKTRSNLMPWTGQFSPELVDALLGTYGKHGDHVIDPFMGSGTVMIEAARMGTSSTGVDINPAA